MYVVDSSVWLDLRTILLVPGAKEFLERLVGERRILVPEEVVREVHPKGGDIGKWVNSQRECHRDTLSLWDLASEVANKYPDLVDYSKKNGADPFVVACALTERENQNAGFGFASAEIVVVASERSHLPRVAIPDACQSEGLRCVNITGWFTLENYRVGP
jgi:hypothetical protein